MMRATVVCRPASSRSRTALVSNASEPSRVFNSVDLPAPDSPKIMPTLPCGMQERTSSRPSPVSEDVAITRTPVPARRRRVPHTSATSAGSQRSTLVSTTTGSAPQSRASTSERATRSRMSGRVSRSAPSGCTMKITSTFAAST